MPWLKLARFGLNWTAKGCLRHDANVIGVTGCEIDYDGERIGFDEAVAALRAANIEAVLYTSPSHTRAKPRWRILCPFSRELPPGDRVKMVARLNGLFQGAAANGESFALSQSFYYGSCNGHPVETAILRGTALDLCDALDHTAKGKADFAKGNDEAKADPVHVDWDNAAALDLDALPVTQRLKDLIHTGTVPKRYKDDRSRLLMAVACGLVAAGCDDATIAAAFKASPVARAHINEQAQPRTYIERQIARARVAEKVKPSDARTVIHFVATDPKGMARKGEAALIAASVELFQQNGKLMRIVRLADAQTTHGIHRDAGAVVLMPATIAWLRAEMMSAARWVTSKMNADGVVELVDVVLNRDVPETYLNMVGEWTVPVLRGIVETPTLWRKGDDFVLLQIPGYDREAGLYYEPGGTVFPEINPSPTDEEAVGAIESVLTLFQEFPFVPDDAGEDWEPGDAPGSVPSASRSVALSALLTGLIRRDMEAAPLHGFDATTAGTGKGFLVRIISTILTGRRAAAMPWVREVNEQRKRLLAVLMEGDPVVLLDNATEPIGGAPINVCLSEPIFKDRVLGTSGTAQPYTNCLMLATGNNLEFEGDFTRKVVRCTMDARLEHPFKREFKRDPLGEARRRRGEFVVAGLTILLGYLRTGRPKKGGGEAYRELRGLEPDFAKPWCGLGSPIRRRQSRR